MNAHFLRDEIHPPRRAPARVLYYVRSPRRAAHARTHARTPAAGSLPRSLARLGPGSWVLGLPPRPLPVLALVLPHPSAPSEARSTRPERARAWARYLRRARLAPSGGAAPFAPTWRAGGRMGLPARPRARALLCPCGWGAAPLAPSALWVHGAQSRGKRRAIVHLATPADAHSKRRGKILYITQERRPGRLINHRVRISRTDGRSCTAVPSVVVHALAFALPGPLDQMTVLEAACLHLSLDAAWKGAAFLPSSAGAVILN
ncbi:hypothetical protein DFH11DRAFT_1731549 [Phellopilus nigrolimitatus]|nr:hypothetical protein DFH11DRAFT_1731549 [Phellopilus nigrolimitatus]